MDEERTTEWVAEDYGGDTDDWWITHPNFTLQPGDHSVTVDLSEVGFPEQLKRLVRLLNRVAPDGVLPDDEASA